MQDIDAPKPGEKGSAPVLNRVDAAPSRSLKKINLQSDLVVVGGGIAGVCTAVTAAREGLKVVLMQDRPVLGGNASSEVRLWLLGATVHHGSNNRWAREGGVVGEIMVENTFRNKEGNPIIFDTVVHEKVLSEPNITLLLNTSMHEVEKAEGDTDRIKLVRGYCAQNETEYEVSAPLFCDASGDGVLGFLSGAAFRMGAESKEEFNELFAPSGEFGGLLGHSIYFYTRNTGKPVKFVAPSYALKDIPNKIPRYKSFNTSTDGCRLWWIEHGGRLDTVHDTESIKWELWRIVYGVWDYIKNSGEFPDAENLTLDWVGSIPGKRESRRFEGDHILRQSDVIQRICYDDTVAYGGWSIDLHPADGVYAKSAGSHHLHAKSIYGIPYRCYYSRNIKNLFLAGRIISTTHVAFGTTRVMATCAAGGQAVGVAAALCKEKGFLPRDLMEKKLVGEVRRRLVLQDNFIPRYALDDPQDLVKKATLTASSSLALKSLPGDGPLLSLKDTSHVQMIPLSAGQVPAITIWVDATADTNLCAKFCITDEPTHHTPETELGKITVPLKAGVRQQVTFCFEGVSMPHAGYGYFFVERNVHAAIRGSQTRVTGILNLKQPWWQNERPWSSDHTSVGGECFLYFCAHRRPGGQLMALALDRPTRAFEPENLLNGIQRPTNLPNAWVPAVEDPLPTLTLKWNKAQTIRKVVLCFDTDFEHPMETVLMGHPENVMPFCVQAFRLRQGVGGPILHECLENHHSVQTITLEKAVTTDTLVLELLDPQGPVLKGLFEIRCYA